ncbi:hypothetical protein GCM10009680_09200 [Streptomyces yatensis]|uniref:Uncharacterized protein n=1 Tax=Streptomyces yatensis TaxID=155177 RepID=A0ABP4SGY7_9ACTN
MRRRGKCGDAPNDIAEDPTAAQADGWSFIFGPRRAGVWTCGPASEYVYSRAAALFPLAWQRLIRVMRG